MSSTKGDVIAQEHYPTPVNAIKELHPFGYKGFLIGENFMKTDNPGLNATKFINELEG